jgi:hypothetical protein
VSQSTLASEWPAVMDETSGTWSTTLGLRLPEDAAGRDTPITSRDCASASPSQRSYSRSPPKPWRLRRSRKLHHDRLTTFATQ